MVTRVTEPQRAPAILPSFDGVPLAVHRMGQGRPVVLLHGLFSNAEVNWIKYGTAARLAGAGFDVIMPDLRAHGQSGHPQGAEAYPADVLVKDLVAVVSALGLSDFDLCGYSLGARTALQAVASGAVRPRRLVLCGMGLQGITNWQARMDFFLDVIGRFGTIPREDPGWSAQHFMRSTKVDLVATRLLLEALRGGRVSDIAAVTVPTRVICGADDEDNGSAEELAAALPDASYATIPGTHMSSVTMPQLGDEIAAFLG